MSSKSGFFRWIAICEAIIGSEDEVGVKLSICKMMSC